MGKNNSIVWISVIACLVLLYLPKNANAQTTENPKYDFALTGLKVSLNVDSEENCEYRIEVQVYINGTNDWERGSYAGVVDVYYSTDDGQNWSYITWIPIKRDEMDTPWLKGKVWPNDFASDPGNSWRWLPAKPDLYKIKGEIRLYGYLYDEIPVNNTKSQSVDVLCSNLTPLAPLDEVKAEWFQRAIEDGYIKFDICRKYPWLCPFLNLHDMFPWICTGKGPVEVFWDDRIGGLDILIVDKMGKIVSETAQLKAPVTIEGKQYNRRSAFNKVLGEKYKIVYWCSKQFKASDLFPLPIYMRFIEKK